MKNKCKCKKPDRVISILNGIGFKCAKCNKWIKIFHKKFHKPTKIRKSKKKYNRRKAKKKLRQKLREEDIS